MEASKFSTLLLNSRIVRPTSSNTVCSCLHMSQIWMHGNLSLPLCGRSRFSIAGNTRTWRDIKLLYDVTCFERQDGTYVPFRRSSRPSFFKPCHVMSEDSEGTLSGESIVLNEQTLERKLQTAVEEENYALAAKIRDNLKLLQEDSKASVLAANSKFYDSFRKGDLAAMQSLWSKGENVCVVHPGASGIFGYEHVMGSWEFVWADYDFPLRIEIKDVIVHVKGNVGYVTCVEMVKTKGNSWGRQYATNVFEKIDGQWFICVHHASHVDL